jgi:hypothetical protein
MLLGRVSSVVIVLLLVTWGAAPRTSASGDLPQALSRSPAAVPAPAPAPAPGHAPPPPSSIERPVPAPPAAAAGLEPEWGQPGLDFAPQVKTLARVTACARGAEIPPSFSPAVVEAHCRMLGTLADQWSKRWLARARAFFDQTVPTTNLPDRVVYPFGGGDLLTALVVFPNASEITTLSLEPAGDPRVLDNLDQAELEAGLVEVRKKVNHLFSVGHSKTTDMGRMTRSVLPGDLTYTLVALEIQGFEILTARFFRVDPSGALEYLRAVDPYPHEIPGLRSPFASVEIAYRARAGGPRRIFRHIAVNLDDAHLAANPAVLRHLEAKGQVAAMTKAASYLLWWKEFNLIRNYLLEHMVWMVSDSTGIPTDLARAAGFEQIPFGRFEGPFLGGGNHPTEVFKKLWAEEGAGPLTFRFGYPDSAGHDHLVITRRATEK